MPELSEILKNASEDTRRLWAQQQGKLEVATAVEGNGSHLEQRFMQLWQEIDGPELESEYRFHETRKWRFDFAHPQTWIAIEIEGGVYSRGRHVRGKGFEGDCEKYNEAAFEGWMVYRLPPSLITEDYLRRIKGHIVQEME